LTDTPTAKPIETLPGKLAAIAGDIKLSHTVFALPFALLATFLAAGSADRLPSVSEFGLIVLCMFLARTVAMTVNRFADAGLDSSNPRTAGRALPSGQLDKRFVLVTTVICAVAFIWASGGFWILHANPWPMILSPLVLAYLVGYSYTKRFTWLCHIYLGTALAMSPIAAVIAIEPGYLSLAEPWLLAGMVACWVGGFDVIYALQDVDHDRSQGLYSMPSSLGVNRALWISRLLHLATLGCLLQLGYISPQLGSVFLTASILTVGLIVLEHVLVWRSNTNHINIAFLTVNGVISLLLGAAGIVEVLASVSTHA
jgi:4-hydroxybenzoate polyprenyltransferase